MKILATYQTKAKWALTVSGEKENLLPILGYYSGGEPYMSSWERQEHTDIHKLAPGENVVMWGTLAVGSHGRGRSSVSYYFYDENDRQLHTSASGMTDVLEAVIKGEFTTSYRDDTCWITGCWTCAKQGTEVTIVPYNGPHLALRQQG